MAKKTTKTNLPMVKVTLEKIATDLPLPEKVHKPTKSGQKSCEELNLIC